MRERKAEVEVAKSYVADLKVELFTMVNHGSIKVSSSDHNSSGLLLIFAHPFSSFLCMP